MKLLDLFCGAGGAAVGYHRAGFDEIVGVDIVKQPRYPFEFIQADVFDFMHGLLRGPRYTFFQAVPNGTVCWKLEHFDVIHASPPCQRWSESTPVAARSSHPDLIKTVRDLLLIAGAPYVIENVDGARRLLRNRFYLCGTMFGLNVHRHRWFECSAAQPLVYSCHHNGHPVVISGSAHGRGEAKVPEMIAALDVPWMKVRAEVRQAIPPAYTEFIGWRLLEVLE